MNNQSEQNYEHSIQSEIWIINLKRNMNIQFQLNDEPLV